MANIWDSPVWAQLKEHKAKEIDNTHLRELLQDAERSKYLTLEFGGIIFDYARQRVTQKTMHLLHQLAETAGLKAKIEALASGKHINHTEDRSVLHMALRAPKTPELHVDGVNITKDVHDVLGRIAAFSTAIRNGSRVGVTGKPLTSIVSIGIGGSYLGVEYVYEALRMEPTSRAAAEGRKLRFLANVDPVDVARALEGLDAETTLVIVISKTFTTAETMLNARTMRNWLVSTLTASGKATEAEVVAAHMCAVSTNIKATTSFGIKPENVFGFWDWVGGRYSVCSAVGMVPLSLHFGSSVMSRFLAGAHSVDVHFQTAPFAYNIPVAMGLLGVWNSTFLGHATRALLPYSQALLRFPAHIQQVDMESNGKRVTVGGTPVPFETGEINFGEPGTNGQHSFYQLLHQGRVVPADFVGFCESQEPMQLAGEPVSNHDELMSNFFAQPDALAVGKTAEEVAAEGTAPAIVPHKVFTGNRPSSSLLFPRLDAYTAGQLLALYEHRTAVEGFIWDIPSFDQWGVELGKKLATAVREQLKVSRTAPGAEMADAFNPATTSLLSRYVKHVDPRY